MAVLAGACGSDEREEAATAGESSGSSTVIDPAIFTGEATTVGGDTVDLASLADKDLVVWFWAPW